MTALPDSIDEAVIVISHLGNQFTERLGNRFGRIDLRYIEQKEMWGTAGAIWCARPELREGKFLILNGDDLYTKRDMENCLAPPLACGVHPIACIGTVKTMPRVETDEDGMLVKFCDQSDHDIREHTVVSVATGAYTLDERFFDYEPVKYTPKEYGLPHTVEVMARDHKVKVVAMQFWHPINTLDELQRAAKALQSSV